MTPAFDPEPANAAALAAARRRVARCRTALIAFLLLSPLSAGASCAGGIAFLKPSDRAFAILPFFVLPVAFLGAAWLARSSLKVARTELAVAVWADVNGLTFRRKAGGTPAAERVYRMVGDVRWTLHMTGDVGGTRVELVNRGWKLDIPEVVEASTDQTEAVVIGVLPTALDFVVAPRKEDGSIHDLTTGDEVRYDHDPEFDRAFVVRAARAVEFPDRFVNRCLKQPGLWAVARGGSLVVFRLNHVCTPNGYGDLLGHALSLAAALV